MSNREIHGFFYGLFMDKDVLSDYEIVPRDPIRAYVDNYKLYIGKRATLWPSAGDRAYGMVYSLKHEELNKLYSGPGLVEYLPEAVLATELDGSKNIACLCFNLPTEPSVGEENRNYSEKLQIALTKLGFPKVYVDSISKIYD